ncbi:MAG: PAS domain S-box protein [Anaerolineae bacterium]|nr:PAS domain S-box protein [Anaerolineae bacterium]
MEPKAKLLIIDDDPASRFASVKVLKDDGYTVLEAETGQEGLELAREHLPDLILLDVVLPDINGIEVCREIKTTPETKNLYVLFYSGTLVEPDHQAEGLEVGGDGYLVRPTSSRELLARVEALLRIKRAEDALRASEERYRHLFDYSLNGFALHEIVIGENGEPVDYIYVTVNKAFEDLTGLPADKIVGKRVTEVIPGIENTPFIAMYGEVAMTGEPRRFEQYTEPLGRYYNITAYSPRKGQFATIFTDITDRKLNEEELRHHKDNLERLVEERTANLERQKVEAEAIFQSAADIMLITDLDANILMANNALTTHTGYSVDEIIGKPAWILGDPEATELYTSQELTATIRIGKFWRSEMVIMRKNGTRFAADVSISPLPSENGLPRGFVIAIHDVSAFKEIEQIKDALLSTAAHELRTPLTSIQGFSEILGTRDLPPERQNRYLHFINEQSLHLGQIIDDLLDVARIQAGRGLEMNPEQTDMLELIGGILRPFIEAAPDRRFQLEGLSASRPVWGDPESLGRVIRNLVDNALKFSPKGSTITVSNAELDTHLEISIQDEGKGLTEAEQESLFKQFYRVDRSNSAPAGTGLGLTICKAIIEKHGGTIRVETAPGQGSKFVFTIPFYTEEQEQAGSRE